MADDRFSMGLFDARIKDQRHQVFKVLGMYFVLMTVAIWGLLSLFWGSTYQLESYFPSVKVYVYDFDSVATPNAVLGPAVVRYLQSTLSSPVHLGIIVRDPAGKTFDDVASEIVGEKAWGAVVINANATSNFEAAMAGTGGLLDGQWAPKGAISLVVAGARWYQVVLEYLLPYLGMYVETPVLEASHQASASFLSTATPATLGELTSAQQAALGTPFAYQEVDLRPILPGQWAGAAPLEAGLIYYIIFAFHIALFFFFSRLPLQGMTKKHGIKIRWIHVCLLRIVPVLFAYFILSLAYTLINKAFLLPTDGNGYASFGPQAGFMVLWMLDWIALASLGLAMEAMLTLLTLKFFPLFLITWILSNITSSFFPATLAPKIFRYGYMMPFWHCTTATKHIMWGTRNRLGLNFGVLLGWCGVSLVTICLFELMWRRIEERKERQESAKDVEGQGAHK
ncbi:uncharacterized protein RHOBADRAFT_51361 [Rhodotorula graminis WP1]|uniref:DUF3533 domain-containing protein n=1 Tax=Rhodotorula graminis (strain WP1) TaxID=578459 RepID=A0A194SA83_RHOGW|nr:uncharacterized protein RHOBADRAFT_51361 [Rhodotorula graminis WP1]KPV77517.1 hypothetical protein RHOBADRAFT_51361 [Rhodotorula graminis WP1]